MHIYTYIYTVYGRNVVKMRRLCLTINSTNVYYVLNTWNNRYTELNW